MYMRTCQTRRLFSNYMTILVPVCLVSRLTPVVNANSRNAARIAENASHKDAPCILKAAEVTREVQQYLSNISPLASQEAETPKLLTANTTNEFSSILQRTKLLYISGEEKNRSSSNASQKNVSISRLPGRNILSDVPSIEAASSSKLRTRHSVRSVMDVISHAEHNSGTKDKSNARISFQHYLNLTTHNISQCFVNREILEFYALSGQISFSLKPPHRHWKRWKCSIKLILPDPDFSVTDIYVPFDQLQFTVLKLRINDVNNENKMWYRTFKGHYRYKNPVNVRLEFIRPPKTYVNLFLNFTSFPMKRFTSGSKGYVLSPGWDANAKTIDDFDVVGRIDVPVNYSIMISFHPGYRRRDTCGRSQLTISNGNHKARNRESQVLVLCDGAPFPKPKIFQTNFVTFHYVCFRGEFQFKTLFSFHHLSAVPEKTSSGKWNCSVAFWPHFHYHISICNTVDECYGGEDEANCSHVYQECGRGGVLIGGGCYVLVVQDMGITWNEAASECLRRDAYLASLNAPDEWNDVTKFFKQLTNSTVYFGLRGNGANFPQLYQLGFQWKDKSFVFYFELFDQNWYFHERYETCSYLAQYSVSSSISLVLCLCNEKRTNAFLCEKDTKPNPYSAHGIVDNIRLHPADRLENGNHMTCPAGHTALKFMAYDKYSKCFASQNDLPTSSCDMSVVPLQPHFKCRNAVEYVSYTLVCDYRSDCSDNTDETFCVFPPCKFGSFICNNYQCVLVSEQCDGIVHCVDGSDEKKCQFPRLPHNSKILTSPKPPVVVNFNGYGFYESKSIDATEIQTRAPNGSVCPESHFLCPGKWTYCMPVFVRCNAVVDCPGREDEAGCDSYVCPGFFSCRASEICVHASHVCDGVFHCPQHDDELLCDFVCPRNCTCLGLTFFCSRPFQAAEFPELRFLDGRGSKMTLGDLTNNSMLVFLSLADCGLESMGNVELLNLQILDLSLNQLKLVEANQINNMHNLQVLSLAGNPLASLFIVTRDQNARFPKLKFLDLSDVSLDTLNTTIFSIFPGLLFLNLSGCGVQRLIGGGLQSLKHLRCLDFERCPLEIFPFDTLKEIRTLTEVWADNYKLCCPALLPSGFQMTNCHSPTDEISSCDALLRSHFYRAFLFVFSILALLGNLCSFVYRVFVNRAASSSSFGAFVTHLCVSDFLMGMYLAVIGAADRLYRGSYLWKDTAWKRSSACSVAGFLSLLSSEVSAFVICFITLDRFLVLHFPFSRLHFRKQSAHVTCATAWLIGAVLAGIPLLPVTSHWEFYSQTGICIPLPITRKDFAGNEYSFSVTIVVNFILFLIIAIGQAFIYWSIRTNTVSACDSTKKSNSLAIARRLITITMSDFLCWFPIGVLGLLASNGYPIPGEVNVFVAVLLLPVNSAINPFLYTLNILLESRRQARERRIQRMIMCRSEASKIEGNTADKLGSVRFTKGQVMQLIENWVSGGLVSVSSLEDVINKHS